MRFPAKKNAGCPKAPRDFPPRKDGILYPPRRVVLGLSSPSRRVCADGRTYGRSRDYYVTTKISRIDRLPNLLSNGAPLAGFARRLPYNLMLVSKSEEMWLPVRKTIPKALFDFLAKCSS